MDVLDSYTGHTDPGGAATRRDLGRLSVSKLSVGPMDNNAYLLRCTATGQTLLIDAANEADRLNSVITQAGGGRLDTLVTTHRHPDHWQALAEVTETYRPTTVAHPLDATELPVPPDRQVDHGDTIQVGDVTLEVIHLRGHTPGSVALLYRDDAENPHLFTGDCLFPGGPGKTWSAADFTSLLDHLEERVFDVLPDATWIYPGHGDDTTIGAERPHLAQWRERGW